MPHVMNIMRLFSIVTIPLLAKLHIVRAFPPPTSMQLLTTSFQGVLVSLVTQSLFMTLQSTLLRLPRIRRRLGV